jgi:hypothetical protein
MEELFELYERPFKVGECGKYNVYEINDNTYIYSCDDNLDENILILSNKNIYLFMDKNYRVTIFDITSDKMLVGHKQISSENAIFLLNLLQYFN